jgi:Uncharacterized protein conserved in bacteria
MATWSRSARLADANLAITREDVQAYLRKEGEAGYVECSNAVLAHFLEAW